MPCDSGPAYGDHDRLQTQVDTLTKLLCRACKLAAQGKVATDNASIAAWWEAHQKADLRRIEEQKKERKRRKKELERNILRLKQELEDVDDDYVDDD